MILFRYVGSEVLKTLLLALGGLSSVIFISFTLAHFQKLKGVSLRFLLALMPNLLPEVLLITLPASLLLAVTFTLGRLASDNELNALRAGGVHLGRVLSPCLILGVILSAATAWVVHVTVPAAHHARRNLLGRAVAGLTQSLGSGVRDLKIADHYIRFKGYREERDASGAVSQVLMEADIFIVDKLGNRESIRAREARLVLDEPGARIVLDLRDAMVTFSKGGSRDLQVETMFDRVTREIDLAGHFSKAPNLSDFTDEDIERALAKQPQSRYPDEELLTEWHRRKAISFAPLFFVIAGGPLAMLLKRGGRVAGIAAVVLPVFAVYFPLTLVSKTMGDTGALPPVVAAWLADGVLALAGLVTFKRFVLL